MPTLSEDLQTLYWRHPKEDGRKVHVQLLHPEAGPYLYFRRVKSPLQTRLAQLVENSKIPKVFLHGSPHVDNYVKTLEGFGLLDFDRAYIGPYSWDIVCALLAVSLRNPQTHHTFLSASLCNVFFENYLEHFHHPEKPYLPYAPLEKVILKPWEKTMEAYLLAGKKWAKKLKKDSLPADDTLALALLKDFFSHTEKNPLKKGYNIASIHNTQGTFGRKRFLYVLQSNHNNQEPIFIDIKETRHYLASAWPHWKDYHNPFHHEGERMMAASQLYAPGITKSEGYATCNGIEYWGREIPTLNRKPSKIFRAHEQEAFLIMAGSQLGRGHALSLQDISAENFLTHFQEHSKKLTQISAVLLKELMNVWGVYCERAGL